MIDKWLLVTAGFSPELHGAALRIESQALNMQLFDTLVIDKKTLNLLCPEYFKRYEHILISGSPGFGYYGWKPAIIDAVLNSKSSKYDGIIWVDAGCEIFPSLWTRFRLKLWMRSAKKQGFWGFNLKTPERLFTKKKLFEYFPSISTFDESPQVQATFLILHGDNGKAIAKKWNSVALTDLSVLDFSRSEQGEDIDFIEHRCDQSIFSLIIKSMGLKPSNLKPKPGQVGLRAIISAASHPIWTSRNRSSITVVPNWLNFFGPVLLNMLPINRRRMKHLKPYFQSIGVSDI